MADQPNDEVLTVRRVKFAIGQNDKDEADAIPENRVELAQNIVSSSSGVYETRKGTTLVADDKGNAAVDGIGRYDKEGGTPELHMVSGGTWYRRQAGDATWTTVASGFSSGARTLFLQAKNILFMSNGIDNVRTWDGSTVTDEGNTNADPPRFHFAIYHQNRLICGRNDESLIYYSSSLDPQTFDRSTNNLKPDQQSGGTGRTLVKQSISSTPGFIYHKNDSSFFFNTNDASPANWSAAVIDPIHGSVSVRSTVFLGSGSLAGGVAYLSKEGNDGGSNHYRIRSIIRTRNDAIVPGPILSRDIEGATLSDLSASNDESAVMFFFDNKLILSFRSTASSNNDKVCVLDFDISNPEQGDFKWQVYSGWEASCFTTFKESGLESLYYGNASADSIVLKAFTGTTDNGTAIVSKVTGRAEDFNVPEINKIYEAVEVYFKGTDDSLATVRVIFDDGSATTLGTVSLEQTGPQLSVDLPFDLSAADRIVAKFPLDSQVSRSAQIEVEHSSGAEGNSMKYLGYVLYGWPENISLGVTK
jgi:hypothetical protein